MEINTLQNVILLLMAQLLAIGGLGLGGFLVDIFILTSGVHLAEPRRSLLRRKGSLCVVQHPNSYVWKTGGSVSLS